MGIVKIAVISDTHIPRRGKNLPQKLLEGINRANLIIHAGDISRDYVIYELQDIANVEAVAGNTDDRYVMELAARKKIIAVENCRIGIIHGDGDGGTTLQRVTKAFEGDAVDCVVFGHSHIPFNETIDGVLYFNPGSPTDKRTQEKFSYGILYVEGKNINGEIVYF